MKTSLRTILLFLFSLTLNFANAQDAAMADGLRAEGKIYVVVLIILIVLTGLIAYLFLTDRKLTRMEREIRSRVQTKR